jgi:alpha-galactosidase
MGHGSGTDGKQKESPHFIRDHLCPICGSISFLWFEGILNKGELMASTNVFRLLAMTLAVAAIGWATGVCPASPPPAGAPTTQTAVARTAAILTPPPSPAPRINGPHVYGERTGKPFFYAISVTGDRPMVYSAQGLPDGLTLDEKRGLITGRTTAAGHHKVKLTASNARGRASIELDVVIGDQVCLTPPLGWNSWNKFAGSVDDAKVRAAADAMVSSGLIDHGWTYINIDDTWEIRPGSADPRLAGPARDSQGRILTNKKFPDMKALADYVHGKGLKFGIYSSPGPLTCAGFEASYQHEDQDAQSYADWGVDYVKYDWCSYNGIARQITAQRYAELLPDDAAQIKSLFGEVDKLNAVRKRTPEQEAQLKDLRGKLDAILAKLDPARKKQIDLAIVQEPYRRFRTSLDKVDRDIVFSFCQYGMGNVWEWGADAGGNTWRTTGDINASWKSLSNIGFGQNGHEPFAGPGHWNDPDMLEVGNGNLTSDEMYSHMTLWSMLDAPLLIGCDMTRMDDLTTSLFTNDEVLAVNQDALGKQAYRIKQDGETEVWTKPLADGTEAVALFNRGPAPGEVAVAWSDLKRTGPQTIRDLWRQKDLGAQDAGWSTKVNSHGAVLIRVGAPRTQQ